MYAKYFNYFAYVALILIMIYLSLFMTMKQLQTDFHYIVLTLIFILFTVGIITEFINITHLDTVKSTLEQ